MSVGDSWQEAMRRGDFAAAWAISDAVLKRRLGSGDTGQHGPRHEQAIWNGGSFEGRRVLVRCYHGLGDTLQYLRYAAPLRQVAREVILWVQPELLALAAIAAGVDRVLPLHDGSVGVEYDIDVEIMELAHALRLTPAQVSPPPYLQVSAAASNLPFDRGGIGIVWQAGAWDPRRSVPVHLMRRLAERTGRRLMSLQRGPAAAAATSIPAKDISTDDVAQAAARMRRLQLVITADTMTAHLAGALGLPVWTMLHADCDWRWMRERSDCVWYPTMRLFRQHRSGDWAGVIDEIVNALSELPEISPQQ